MNTQKLDALASQAGFDVDRLRAPHPGGFPREDMLALESFAELIVRECAGLCDINDKEQGDILREHFGVEDRAVPILSADEQALFAGITSSKLFTIAGAKKHFGVEE